MNSARASARPLRGKRAFGGGARFQPVSQWRFSPIFDSFSVVFPAKAAWPSEKARRRRGISLSATPTTTLLFVGTLQHRFCVAFGEKHQFSSEKARRRRATGARRSTFGEGARAGALLCGGPIQQQIAMRCRRAGSFLRTRVVLESSPADRAHRIEAFILALLSAARS